jgi:hypothetical protein
MAQRQFRSDDTDSWTYGFGDGSNGAYTPSTGTDAPIDGAVTGTATETHCHATNVNFAAGQIILIHQTQGTGVGNWELNKIDSYTAGTINTKKALINTYGTGAQVLVLKQYSSVLIDTGVTLTAKAWDGTVGGIVGWFCNGTVTVTGSITTTGKGFTGGSNHNSGNGYTGEGSSGASKLDTNAYGSGGGGGQERASGGNGGGGGGHFATGTTGDVNTGGDGGTAGSGGEASGHAHLTSCTFGGGGGKGGAEGSDNSPAGGIGGVGGGIVFIAAKTITVTGSILANGSAGANSASEGNGAGGGGGGAGGSLLLKGQTLTLGTNICTATGGSGGSKYDTSGNGGAGSTGRIHADYSISVGTSDTNPELDSDLDTTIFGVGGPRVILFT